MESEDTPNDDDGMNTIRKPNRTDSRTRTKLHTNKCPVCEQEWTNDSCTRCDSINEQTVTAEEDIIRKTTIGEIQIMEVPLPMISDELEQEFR